MNFKIIIAFLILVSFYSCDMAKDRDAMQQWKQEILKSEADFAKMASEKGIHDAFVAFAAEEAVIMRNDSLVVGKKAIDLFYENRNSKGLSWKPDFVEVSASGDLAYTYGHYTFFYEDSDGKAQENQGIFHTIWKKQSDGNWRFVWD